MSDAQVTFVPAETAQTSAPQSLPLQPEVHKTDAPNGRPPQWTPQLDAPPAEVMPVPIPSDVGVQICPETGKKFRPFTIGSTTVRCAWKIPADNMLHVIEKQQRLSSKEPGQMTMEEQVESLHLLGEMVSGVVWDRDEQLVRAALTDKEDPVDLADLSAAVSALWQSYNNTAGVGKEQPGS